MNASSVNPMETRGGSRILERGGPTMKDFEMSRRSRLGDAEGVAGGECERGLNALSHSTPSC